MTQADAGEAIVLIGTLGRNPAIDALVKQGRLDVRAIRGQWETFLIAHVAQPMSGVKSALVIVGSDRRGTAFGVYELARAIGVSPWYWWADVAPARKSTLYVDAGVRSFGPPSVKYRGIFLNDEDWGLRFGLGVDDETPREIVVDVRDGSREWAQSVLNATVVATAAIDIRSAGTHTLRIYGVDAGVVLDEIVIHCGT